MDNLDAGSEAPVTASQAQAFTVDTAVAALGKSMAQEATPRSPTGQYAAKDKPETLETDPAKVVDLKTGKPPEPAAPVEVDTDDDDLEFEIPSNEEGKEAKRLKLSELYERYEKAEALEKEVETLRTQTKSVPAEYTAALQEAVQVRGQYLKGLEQIARIINPQAPSLELLNPNHPKYDPDLYYATATKFENDKANLQELRADQERLQREQDDQQQALNSAFFAGEREAILKAWPEFKDVAVRKQMGDDLIKTYGFDIKEIKGIADHRQLLVIRDALELRALKAKQAEAVKVVRAKPKLVKGAARNTTDPKATAKSNAMSRLQTDNSMDAAARALKALGF